MYFFDFQIYSFIHICFLLFIGFFHLFIDVFIFVSMYIFIYVFVCFFVFLGVFVLSLCIYLFFVFF